MMKNVWKKLLAAALLCVGAHAGAAPILNISTGTGSGPVGSIVDFNVGIADIADLYSYQFSLTYDARYLRAIGGVEGGFLGAGGNTIGDVGFIDNGAGTISFVYNSLLGPSTGVSGSGLLATFRFEAIDVGNAGLSFFDVIFIDGFGSDIVVDARGAQFVVVEDAPGEVPEPASILLIGAGLAGVAALRRRRA